LICIHFQYDDTYLPHLQYCPPLAPIWHVLEPPLTEVRKGKVDHSYSAQVWITQFYLQTTPCLPLPRKRSPDVAATDCVIQLQLPILYRPRKGERLSWLSWLTYSGRFTLPTYVVTHPLAVGRAQDRKCSPARDRRSTAVQRYEPCSYDMYVQCSSACGEGVHHRLVHCSAEPQRCHEITKPKSEKSCKQKLPCGGRWFTGPWGQVRRPLMSHSPDHRRCLSLCSVSGADYVGFGVLFRGCRPSSAHAGSEDV